MTINSTQLSEKARHAVRIQDWGTVSACANSIIQQDINNPEGYFLSGLIERVSNRPAKAAKAFERALELDERRYDAAIELANQYSIARRNGDVANLLAKYEDKLANSSMYLDLAGTVYTDIGMPEKAWPLYQKANELQPGVDLFQANLAACGVFLGKIDESKKIYQSLLKRFPNHQRNHYQLARLSKAKDTSHIQQMQEILKSTGATEDKNIFMYYALGKELEDLERWQESYSYYKKGGDAVCNVAKYEINNDIALIDKIIDVCNKDWLVQGAVKQSKSPSKKTPIFIVGLPRTGTTLTERIISSHSLVESVGETQFLQMVLRRESGVQSIENMTAEMIEALVDSDPETIAKCYIDSVNYRLAKEPFFIDKLPFNFLFLGFIAKAWPDARIVHLGRNPMDACFSMYKQIFTWAYKFSYSLEGLGQYYVAYDRLRNHWRDVLQERLIEVEYEFLVSDTENQTRLLLDKLGLDFERSCLDFDQNKAPSATASSVQIREKTHDRSINKWQRFSDELNPLKEYLESAGINVK
ncbi:tetratricopeptide repeat-containing sulfotransferase family protein [uncultured Paraglaciecola sp.]|uniref:tetratricopeptide repeat-containing sulfotransferase family protein n=1 Tax=uncultured Paraglaciecola sp. TaxID=1765024 RepID=UPI0025F18931|nr:tetratricopeptide repeat-containing sulfotransferase family protein [uncultured Paraglaciecola sp.]